MVPLDHRPLAVVAWVTPVTTERGLRASMPQGLILRYMGLVVTAYPTKGGTPRDATVEASRVASTLQDLVEVGLEDPDADPPVAVSYPLHVPIYDYDLLPVGDRDRLPPPGGVIQQAMIVDHSVQPIPDPADDLLWTVVLTLRVRYYRPGRERAAGPEPPAIRSIPATPDFP